MRCTGAVLWMFLVLSAAGSTLELGIEPRYASKFQYDQQLLEKMIRKEVEMEKWEVINEKLGLITRVKERVDQLMESDKLEKRISEVLGNITRLQEQVNHLSE
ncbi:hypothetical protein DPMN_011867 [Dreissena polymorpha]|uniref:Uncharacterized protein n=1 Tax=Dreissena polymorpha TaxID=45954 RepID=A0A9D4N4X3_DREPO|nr:hypothetical protein DPMN_011867 [Dreissena polymorpha]